VFLGWRIAAKGDDLSLWRRHKGHPPWRSLSLEQHGIDKLLVSIFVAVLLICIVCAQHVEYDENMICSTLWIIVYAAQPSYKPIPLVSLSVVLFALGPGEL